MLFTRLMGNAAASVIVVVAGVAGSSVASATTLRTFDHSGSYAWTVPSGIYKVTFDVFGANGGSVSSDGFLVSGGGNGGESKGTFKVKPGQIFEIVVGGAGGSDVNGTGSAGGFNGGGSGGAYGAGGGGSSDVRIGGTGNPCATNRICAVTDRIIAAGGGGGGGPSTDGGAGGGLEGQRDSGNWTPAGLQSGPLGCGGTPGCFGNGGSYNSGAGGGGGWFGGYGSSDHDHGGGGGSGYVSRLALSSSFPGGARTGDGLVVIKTA